MQENKKSVSKNFLVPKKIQKQTQQKTLETTLSQIAHSDLMIGYYSDRAAKCSDPKEAAQNRMQADKIETSREFNIGFVEWLEGKK